MRGTLNLTSDALLYPLVVVGVAVAGGVVVGRVAAVAASILLSFYFVPPLSTFTIAQQNNALALAVLS